MDQSQSRSKPLEVKNRDWTGLSITKVDGIEFLSEVLKHWPVLPEGTEIAYILNLNKDKRWHEAMGNNKILQVDCFLKQEVRGWPGSILLSMTKL